MTGSSVFDYVHPSDQQELAEQLGLNGSHHYSSPATAPRPASPAAGAAPDDDTSQGSTPPPRPGSPATSERGQSQSRVNCLPQTPAVSVANICKSAYERMKTSGEAGIFLWTSDKVTSGLTTWSRGCLEARRQGRGRVFLTADPALIDLSPAAGGHVMGLPRTVLVVRCGHAGVPKGWGLMTPQHSLR